MSKVASYLQEHILGEIVTNPAILRAMSHDGSVLEITPEMVAYPRTTNDIRKIARFAWQLAEKGHTLPLTARGYGMDQTGAALGRGIILVLPAHMNRVLELDVKQKLVRVQPGINAGGLNDALMLHSVAILALPSSMHYSTLGGAVLNNASGPLSGKYGDMREWTQQLEVVLANGDVLQTGRISKRELNKRKGLQTLEGEIYRGIDNLIEDNKELIAEKLSSTIRNNVGYSAIAKVKGRDGSFDLTPLIVGSQGTLGIVSEMIMKSEFTSNNTSVALIALKSRETARDVLDKIDALTPALFDYYDGELFNIAAAAGKQYDFSTDMKGKIGAVILVGFDDFSERVRKRHLKKLRKLIGTTDAILQTADGDDARELLAVQEVMAYSLLPTHKDASAPPLIDGAYVPRERFEEFSKALFALATKYHVTMPIHSRANENIIYARPTLHLHKVSDKQKVFKLIDEYGTLVEQYSGHLIAEDGEGRLKSRALTVLDEDIRQLFVAIKELFDPYGILNPGIKQVTETRHLVSYLRSEYDTAASSNYVPYN